MAKNATATATRSVTSALKGGALVTLDDVDKEAALHAGDGISDRMEDNIVPLVYLLQSNSKPATKGHERYVPGASGGNIWLRNESPDKSLIDGIDKGMTFQPCRMTVCWLEWLPDRGGLVGRHKDRPKEAELKDVQREDGTTVKAWRMPNGNSVNESREFAGFVHQEGQDPLPYVIPLSGTGHTVGRMWMSSMRAKKLPDGTRAPIYRSLYLLKTKLRSSGKFTWYQYEVSDLGRVKTVDDIRRGAELFKAFETGTKEAGVVEDIGGEASDTTGDGTSAAGGREVDED